MSSSVSCVVFLRLLIHLTLYFTFSMPLADGTECVHIKHVWSSLYDTLAQICTILRQINVGSQVFFQTNRERGSNPNQLQDIWFYGYKDCMNGNLNHNKINPTTVSADAHIQLFIEVLTFMNTREGKLCRTQTNLSSFAYSDSNCAWE